MTITQAKDIVRHAYPAAVCCALSRGGFWIFRHRISGAGPVAQPIIHGLSRGNAWKAAAKSVPVSQGGAA